MLVGTTKVRLYSFDLVVAKSNFFVFYVSTEK